MSMRYLGAVISATPPTVTAPTGGEGGSASGAWTLQQQMRYAGNSTWPLPVLLKQLWSFGGNAYGQLGLNNITNYSSPKQIGNLTNWSSASLNNYSPIAVKTDGTLWAWGRNNIGQLGLGTSGAYSDYSSPKQVGALTNWLQVTTGYQFALAVKTNGTLWGWGSNTSGVLGTGNTSVYSSPKQIGSLTNWLQVSSGYRHTLAIKTDGTLWSWGWSSSGQLGLGNTTSYSSPKQVGALTNWASVSAGNQWSLALKTDGTIWSWGQNGVGQLGTGNTVYRSSPVQIGALTTWATISANNGDSGYAIKTDGTLWSWGQNISGELGLGNTTNYSAPRQVGALTTWSKISGYSGVFAIKTDKTLWAWGYNGNGNLGLGNTTNRSSPVQVGSDTKWLNVFSGNRTTLAIKLA